MRFRICMLFLASLLLFTACGEKDKNTINDNGQDVVNNENDQEIENNDHNNDVGDDEAFTISAMEPTPFEEIAGKTAVKLNTADWSDPYDVEELRWKMYYGDNEFITAAPDQGIFRYDLKNDETIWNIDGRVTEIMMHDGVLYAAQIEKSNTYANVGTLDLKSSKLQKIYEAKNYTIVTRLHFIDNLMLFAANLKDSNDNQEKDLIVYDLSSDSILWTKPVLGMHDQPVVDLDENVLLVNEFEAGEDRYEADETAYIYDKDTGEDKFNIVGTSIRKTPIVNNKGIYFADFKNNIIQLFDFDGTLKTKLEPDIEFNHYQLIQPVATEDAFIYADNEGIVWYDTELSTIQHRVELGDSTIRYMVATEDRLFAIVSEKTEDSEENFYNISLDLKTGEVFEKIALDTNENSIRADHVYNNKYHFAVIDVKNQKEVYYVFSSDVNKPLD